MRRSSEPEGTLDVLAVPRRQAADGVLEEREVEYLLEMFSSPSRIWGVERGHEAILTKDGSTLTLCSSRLSSGVTAPLNREAAVRLFETAFAFDTMEVGHTDYSVKPAKFLASLEQQHMELLQHITILPLFYGFMQSRRPRASSRACSSRASGGGS